MGRYPPGFRGSESRVGRICGSLRPFECCGLNPGLRLDVSPSHTSCSIGTTVAPQRSPAGLWRFVCWIVGIGVIVLLAKIPRPLVSGSP